MGELPRIEDKHGVHQVLQRQEAQVGSQSIWDEISTHLAILGALHHRVNISECS